MNSRPEPISRGKQGNCPKPSFPRGTQRWDTPGQLKVEHVTLYVTSYALYGGIIWAMNGGIVWAWCGSVIWHCMAVLYGHGVEVLFGTVWQYSNVKFVYVYMSKV